MALKRKFMQSWKAIGANDDGSDAYAELNRLFEGRRRHFHNGEFIELCFRYFDTVKQFCEHPDHVCIAVFFHQAVYVPFARNNHEKSAEYARSMLKKSGVPNTTIEHICSLIAATSRNSKSRSIDAAIIEDIVTAWLALPQREYVAKMKLYIKEFPPGLDKEELKARVGFFIDNFLRRQHIFRTSYFLAAHELQARNNLAYTLHDISLR